METHQQLEQQTEEHYEAFPFDFLTAEDEANIETLQPAPFRRFVDQRLRAGMKVAEIGCGPGRGTLFMVRRKLDVVAVDLSEEALRLAGRRAPEATFVHASNLALPFDDESFDAVVSDGVIHHTPDPHQSLKENARILKRGGNLYLGVYRRKRYYYYVYTHLGRPVRWLEKHAWGRTLINLTLLPVYYGVHLIKSRGKRTWKGAKNFFYDYIITPQATFHTREEIESWGHEFGLALDAYEENVGNVHAFAFVKKHTL
ncbi:class I SAM-dependent methyltransferase [Verrucomicrobiales bacterium]|jgi:ubiquinone/menaquinone biosynthesis C-methylase UbiE|nr:class I SAM-dependent methyltransferase [Verrucomicrobiales bacterium]